MNFEFITNNCGSFILALIYIVLTLTNIIVYSIGYQKIMEMNNIEELFFKFKDIKNVNKSSKIAIVKNLILMGIFFSFPVFEAKKPFIVDLIINIYILLLIIRIIPKKNETKTLKDFQDLNDQVNIKACFLACLAFNIAIDCTALIVFISSIFI